MTTSETAARSVIVEKEFPHPPEKVWRALTESNLIEQWLMKNDFQPAVGRVHSAHGSRAQLEWRDRLQSCGGGTPQNTFLHVGHVGHGSVVTFTLTPTGAGTHVRVEQAGFSPDQEATFKGAKYGWQKFHRPPGTYCRWAEITRTGKGDLTMKTRISMRLVLRWIHIVVAIPIYGYIYSPLRSCRSMRGLRGLCFFR